VQALDFCCKQQVRTKSDAGLWILDRGFGRSSFDALPLEFETSLETRSFAEWSNCGSEKNR